MCPHPGAPAGVGAALAAVLNDDGREGRLSETARKTAGDRQQAGNGNGRQSALGYIFQGKEQPNTPS